MIKKLLLAGIMTAMVLSGCSSSDDKKEENTNTTQNEENTSSDPDAEYEALKEKLLGGAGDKFPQLEEPKEGEEIAIVKTNMGDIKIKLCPEEAPKAVENFVTHAKEGYYDGLTIHRVVKDFVIQGGDPAGNGTGGESIWGEPFEDEFSQDMYHFNGAVAMANSGANTNGSQFYIVARPTMLDGYFEYVDSVTEENGDAVLAAWTAPGATSSSTRCWARHWPRTAMTSSWPSIWADTPVCVSMSAFASTPPRRSGRSGRMPSLSRARVARYGRCPSTSRSPSP